MERGDVERLFQLLASEAALGERFEVNGLGFTNAYVTIGPRSRDVLNGSLKLSMSFNDKKGKGKKALGLVAAEEVDEDENDDEDEDHPVAPTWKPLARKPPAASRPQPGVGYVAQPRAEKDIPMLCLEELQLWRESVSLTLNV